MSKSLLDVLLTDDEMVMLRDSLTDTIKALENAIEQREDVEEKRVLVSYHKEYKRLYKKLFGVAQG